MYKKYEISLEIAGPTAMWTRPDSGDCPVSYPAPTYAATKAIFESILWGPAVSIVPTKVEICNPIIYHNYYTNYGGPLRKNEAIKKNNNYQLLATVLVDVCYRLYAEVTPNHQKEGLPEKALQWDSKTTSPGHAYQAIFNRRLAKGACFSIPVLGWKEFTPSYFGPFREETTPLTGLETIEIPSMMRQVFPQYASQVAYVYDQNVKVENGVLHYPPRRQQYAE